MEFSALTNRSALKHITAQCRVIWRYLMIKNYRLRSTVGRSYSTGPEDTLDTKNTLKSLGYYETPSYGMTPYPDEPMFQAI